MGRATIPGNSVSWPSHVSAITKKRDESSNHGYVGVRVDQPSKRLHLVPKVVLPYISNSGIILVLEWTAESIERLVTLDRTSSCETHLSHLTRQEAPVQHAPIKAIVQVASQSKRACVGRAPGTEGGSAE